MEDGTFGNINYNYGWRREYLLCMFDKIYPITLVIPCDECEGIEPAQREAFAQFECAKNRLEGAAASAIYSYYLKIADEVRKRVGPTMADMIVPTVEKISDLASIVTPTELLVQQSYGCSDRMIGMLFDCSWDASLGLAVKFENERIVEIGTQDIVL